MAQRVGAGDDRAVARALRWIDDGHPEAPQLLKRIWRKSWDCWIIGVTGSPGVGKSSLTDRLISHYRNRGEPVGVLAVDPSSPFTGGAILGDRVRMMRHSGDSGVFIRSLATRGVLGGLSRSTADSLLVLAASGKRILLVETVGVGQDEVDVARLADTTLLILSPGAGDDVQAMKAGIFEIGDLYVINKADREGADQAAADIEQVLSLSNGETGGSQEAAGARWRPPVVKVSALNDTGVGELVTAVEAHCLWKSAPHRLVAGRRKKIESQLISLLERGLAERGVQDLRRDGKIEQALRDMDGGHSDPYTEAERLVGERMA